MGYLAFIGPAAWIVCDVEGEQRYGKHYLWDTLGSAQFDSSIMSPEDLQDDPQMAGKFEREAWLHTHSAGLSQCGLTNLQDTVMSRTKLHEWLEAVMRDPLKFRQIVQQKRGTSNPQEECGSLPFIVLHPPCDVGLAKFMDYVDKRAECAKRKLTGCPQPWTSDPVEQMSFHRAISRNCNGSGAFPVGVGKPVTLH